MIRTLLTLAAGIGVACRIPIGAGAAVQFNWILSGVLRLQGHGVDTKTFWAEHSG
jgi:hypothetical protein